MGWTKVTDKKFATELSDIEAYQLATQGKQVRCPKCRVYIPNILVGCKHAMDKEGDVTHFTLRHGCGANLVIFND